MDGGFGENLLLRFVKDNNYSLSPVTGNKATTRNTAAADSLGLQIALKLCSPALKVVGNVNDHTPAVSDFAFPISVLPSKIATSQSLADLPVNLPPNTMALPVTGSIVVATAGVGSLTFTDKTDDSLLAQAAFKL